MITCLRNHFEQFCSSRGYTLDEVLPCVVSRNGEVWTIDVEHSAYPRIPRRPEITAPDLARTDAPSFLTKVKNFASAAVSHVAAGMPMASDEEIIRRHDICLTCEHLQNDACILCFADARFRGWPGTSASSVGPIRAARPASGGR
ncbi:MAG: hypothetical protein EBT15_12355 [Betaproteobacteria bacterium]|nr:hypothetical protein [Betaproteobacteria bacterium]